MTTGHFYCSDITVCWCRLSWLLSLLTARHRLGNIMSDINWLKSEQFAEFGLVEENILNKWYNYWQHLNWGLTLDSVILVVIFSWSSVWLFSRLKLWLFSWFPDCWSRHFRCCSAIIIWKKISSKLFPSREVIIIGRIDFGSSVEPGILDSIISNNKIKSFLFDLHSSSAQSWDKIKLWSVISPIISQISITSIISGIKRSITFIWPPSDIKFNKLKIKIRSLIRVFHLVYIASDLIKYDRSFKILVTTVSLFRMRSS